MLDTAIYLVTKDIALRSGLINSRYRIADGRFVLDNKDLSRVRFTTDEYINGLSGVEKTDELTAKTLIAQNGYKMGEEVVEQPTPVETVIEPENVQEEVIQEEEPVVQEAETPVEEPTNVEEEATEPIEEEEVVSEEETENEEPKEEEE